MVGLDAAKLVEFGTKLSRLQEEGIPTAEAVNIIDDLHSAAGFGQHTDEFSKVDGIRALVHYATSGWPPNGRVCNSEHPYDKVIDADIKPELDWQTMTPRRDQHSWRSPRRMAISALSDMGNYQQYVSQMEAAGFFKADVLPKMVEQSLSQIDYSLQNKGRLFTSAKDQIQPIAVDLLNICANACVRSMTLGYYMAQHTALRICKLYKDPQTLWIEKTVGKREKLRRLRRAQGWDEERIADAVHVLKEHQYMEGVQTDFGCKEHFCEMGGLDYFFIRLFIHLTQICTQDQLVTLIHEGGLTNKLKGCSSPSASFSSPYGPDAVIFKLTEVWTQKARGLSRDFYNQILAEESKALELRQAGNAAFKEGRLTEALQLYYQAAGHNPQDYALFNNISLVALKNADPHHAMLAAQESIAIDPAVSKSWCRLGDAYRDTGRWQLAHLAYTCALELAPYDTDIKARKDAARTHLAEVWDIDEIPHPGKDKLRSDKVLGWMRISKQQIKRATRLTAMMEAMDIYDSVISGREGQSRVVACMQLKKDIESARGLAVATGIITPAQLPASCRNLKRPDQVHTNLDQWSMSWTDLPMRHKRTGLIKHQLTIMSASDSTLKATAVVVGTPGLPAVKRVLLEAITAPSSGKPGKPASLFLAHRLFPLFDKVSEMCSELGIRAAAETLAEAKQSAANNDTDWQGYNNADTGYGDDNDDDGDEGCNLLKWKADPENGHLPVGVTADPAAAAAAAAAGEAGSDARQQRDSASGEQSEAVKSSSGASSSTAAPPPRVRPAVRKGKGRR